MWPPKCPPSTSASGRSSPMTRPFISSDIALRNLWARTKLDLYDSPRSRDIASMLLPFTSLQKMAAGGEVAAQGQLVAGEQRARRDREILAAVLAAPARRTGRAAALVV